MSTALHIRADASSQMGIGHVMRCMALAQAWLARGGQVCLISCNLDPGLVKKLSDQGIRVCPVDRAWPDPLDLDQTLGWVGRIPGTRPWVVVDGYHFDHAFQRSLRQAGCQVLVLDDACHLDAYDADILVNPNPWASRLRYPAPRYTRILAGSAYVPLRKQFSGHFPTKTAGEKDLRILVTLGGTDPAGLTPSVVQALAGLGRPDIHVKVVLGPGSRVTMPAPAGPGRFERLPDPDMAELMTWADLAVTAGGSTCWELCRAGVPFIVFPVADNQTGIAASLEAVIGAINAGSPEHLSVPAITDLIHSLIQDPGLRREISCLGQDLIDGNGALRILKEMAAGPLSMDAFTRNQYRFATAQGDVVGQVTLESEAGRVDIACCLNPSFENLGLEQDLIEKSLELRMSLGQPLDQWHQLSREPGVPARPDSKTITLVSDPDSWLTPDLRTLFAKALQLGHRVRWVHRVAEILPSDIGFYLSCGQLVPPEILEKNRHNIVVHGSDLPKGRGWSPISWQILEGQTQICMTLFEAGEKVDTGPIYLQKTMFFRGWELIREIRQKTARTTLDLCLEFLEQYDTLVRSPRQPRGEESRYPRRTPKDSELDPDKTIREQFNLLRIVDNERYPAFFSLKGTCYKLTITPMEPDTHENP